MNGELARVDEDRGPSLFQILHAAIHHVVYHDDAAPGIVDEHCDGWDDLWNWHRALSSIRTAAWRLAEAVEADMIRDLQGQAIHAGMGPDAFIVYAQAEPPTRRIRDPKELAKYLELSAGAQLAFRSSDIKVQGVRAWAQSKGDDPDEIEARFFEYVGDEGPVSLRMNRLEYAPWWALGLRRGERMDVPPPKGKEQPA